MLDLKELNLQAFEKIEVILEALEIEFEDFDDNIYCKCPIHEGSDNDRGFSISREKSMWKCWTRGCEQGLGNTIFGLVRGVLTKRNGDEATFSDALRFICSTLQLGNSGPKKKVSKEPSEFSKVVKIFNRQIDASPPSQMVDELKYETPSLYFMSRGFSAKTLEHFGVGDYYNKGSDMNQRAIIPIYDSSSNLVSYMGRAIRDYIKPKFLFTKGFDKRYFLYNHNNALEKSQQTSCMFITEGQGEVWRLHESGVENTVGIFGKSITKQQKTQLLKTGITRLVILTDNDQAGRESKIKIQRELSRDFTLFFPRFNRKDVGEMSTKQIEEMILPQVEGMY